MYIDKYHECENIGKGNFGQALKVIDKKTNEVFVSKKIILSQLSEKERANVKQEVCNYLRQKLLENLMMIMLFDIENHFWKREHIL